MLRWLRRALEGLLALLYPQGNRCLLCGRTHLRGPARLLCDDCAAALEDCRADERTAAEREEVAEFVWIAAPYYYADEAGRLVRLLKYGDTRAAALPLGQAMARLASPERWDLLAPVPLHRKRLRRRGYNQAALLCAEVARATGLPMAANALVRVRGGRSQVGRSRAQRLKSLVGAFRADPAAVADKRVLLVDDVCTTGATGAACAVALWQAEAAEVGLLTACRSRPSDRV